MTANDGATLRDKVRIAYSAAAESPEEKHAFPVARGFAESLGYPADLLDHLPAIASEAFAGVSNVSVLAEIPSGATVLDLGCGVGLDALIAARRVGPAGKVIAVDFSRAMLSRTRQARRKLAYVILNCAKQMPNGCLSTTKRSMLPWSTGFLI